MIDLETKRLETQAMLDNASFCSTKTNAVPRCKKWRTRLRATWGTNIRSCCL